MNLRLLLPLAGLLFVAAVQPAPVDEVARAKELMKPFAGNWDTEAYFMGMGPLKGTEEVQLVAGGLVAVVKASVVMGPAGNVEGHGMMGYDPKTKVWNDIWADDADPGLTVNPGTWSADGKNFTVEAEIDMGTGAGPQKMQMIKTITGADTREVTMKVKDAKADAPPTATVKYKRRAN